MSDKSQNITSTNRGAPIHIQNAHSVPKPKLHLTGHHPLQYDEEDDDDDDAGEEGPVCLFT